MVGCATEGPQVQAVLVAVVVAGLIVSLISFLIQFEVARKATYSTFPWAWNMPTG